MFLFVDETFVKCQGVIEMLLPELSKFHTRTMRKVMLTKFGRIAPNVLCYFYQDLTGDKSASNDLNEVRSKD